MVFKIFLAIFGFILMVIGLCYIIVYTNLLTFGYTINEYFSFLVTRYECWFFLIGFFIETLIIFRKGK